MSIRVNRNAVIAVPVKDRIYVSVKLTADSSPSKLFALALSEARRIAYANNMGQITLESESLMPRMWSDVALRGFTYRAERAS
jgi:hypothetical protein